MIDVIRHRWIRVRSDTVAYLEAVSPDHLALRGFEEGRSVKEISRHILAASRTVLEGVSDGSFDWSAGESKLETFSWSEILAEFRELPDILSETVDGEGEDWLAGDAAYGLTREELLWQTIEHEIHHRAQISMILRTHGIRPPRLYA